MSAGCRRPRGGRNCRGDFPVPRMLTAWKAIPTLPRTCAHCCSGLRVFGGGSATSAGCAEIVGIRFRSGLFAGGRRVRILSPPVKKDPPLRDVRPFQHFPPERDRGFESVFLHQRVCSEPDFLDQGAESFSGGPEVQLSIDVGRGRINTSSNPRGNGHDQA
jgi:hypothetical protein